LKTYLNKLILLLLLLFAASCTKNNIQNVANTNTDSISAWIKNSKNKKLSREVRKLNLQKAYTENLLQENDSIKNSMLLKIAFCAYKLNDSLFFVKTNNEAYELSRNLKDTVGIADTHWNKGLFYSRKEILDSTYYHYYQAYKYYKLINNEYYSGRMLFNMAIAQKNIRNYTGSEILSFQAISKFDKKKHALNLYRCYSNLGIVYDNLTEFKKAIEYHNIALSYLKKTTDKRTFKESSLNNIGLVYHHSGNYTNAIKFYKEGLKNSDLKKSNINLYAKLIDNLAYSKFLNNDTLDIKPNFYRALKIRDSIKNTSGVLISCLHLSKYYLYKKDTIKAIKYAKKSLVLAKDVHNNRDYLVALKLLSEIELKKSKTHLFNHVSLSDSLQNNERKLRDKFTRIRFETDEYIEETNRLSAQQTIILVASFSLLAILSLLYFMRLQRSKNRALQSEAEQQKANEEVYKLLLKQQAKLEEGRLHERHRISEELHDGVLGRIFGTRMGMGFLDLKGDDETKAKHQLYVDELQEIEKEIRVISHELKNELLSGKADYIQVVEHLVEEQSIVSGFEYKITDDDSVHWSMINDAVKINCYRMVQEAVQNINKYAQAKLVTIHFSVNDSVLSLSIQDDGLGFDITKKSQGIGLKNITARTKKINGTFVISSVIGEGTLLSITIPLADTTI